MEDKVINPKRISPYGHYETIKEKQIEGKVEQGEMNEARQRNNTKKLSS